MPPSLISLPRPLITRLLSSRWTMTRTGTSSLWRVQRRATGWMTFSPKAVLDINKPLAHGRGLEEKRKITKVPWERPPHPRNRLVGHKLLDQLGRINVPVVGQNIGSAQNHFAAVVQVKGDILQCEFHRLEDLLRYLQPAWTRFGQKHGTSPPQVDAIGA